MSNWRIRLFGELAVERDGEVVLQLRTRKDDLLLAYLALAPATTHVRSTVASTLWPKSENVKGRKILSFNLFSLKQRLGQVGLDGALIETRTTLRLAPHLSTDVQEFTDLVQRATSPTGAQSTDQGEQLGRAIALYGDGLLPSYRDVWLDAHRSRLEKTYLQAVAALEWAHAGASQSAYQPSGRRHNDEDAAGRGDGIGIVVGPIGAEEAEVVAPAWRRSDEVEELRQLAGQVEKLEERLASPERWNTLEEVERLYEGRVRELLARKPRTSTIEPLTSIAASLWRYWYLRAHYSEGATTIDRLLTAGLTMTARTRAKALHASGTLAYFNGDHQRAAARLQEAMQRWQEIDDDDGLMRTLVNLGMSHFGLQEYDKALALYEQARAIATRQGKELFLSTILFNASLAALQLEDAPRARKLLNQRLELGAEVLDESARAATHIQLATAALLEDEDSEALRQARLAWNILQDSQDHRGRSVALSLLGRCAQRAGELSKALGLYEQAFDEARSSGDVTQRAEALSYLAIAQAVSGQRTEADRLAEQARQLYRVAGAVDAQHRFERDWESIGARKRRADEPPASS